MNAQSRPLIVFDLDGTLIDSARDLVDSTNDVIESYGGARLPVEAIVQMVGDGARMLVARAIAASGRHADEDQALERFHDIYDRRLLGHTAPYEGIPAIVLTATNRASLAVLTNKPEAPTRRLLDAFDLGHRFQWVIGGDASFPRKPDPAGLQWLMEQASTTPRETLMVGDSILDAETARAAGTRFCLARYGFGQARGETALLEDELAADQPLDLLLAIDLFLDGLA